MRDIPIGTLGRIVGGPDAGRFVEVVDDSVATGGFLILTYASEARDEGFDSWVESIIDVELYFDEAGWDIEWPAPDASAHEEVNGRMRGVLIRVADQLPASTVGLIDELIDSSEATVGLEIMSDMLVESGARLERDIVEDITRLAGDLQVGTRYLDQLGPLVEWRT